MNERRTDRHRIRRFELPNGWVVFAGGNDSDNDHLTFGVARKRDLWFHAHGHAGSHVILQVREDQDPDKETIRAAAEIAAYFSKARGGGRVAVVYTRAGDVRKPSGAPPGTVHLRQERRIKVRPNLPDGAGPRNEC